MPTKKALGFLGMHKKFLGMAVIVAPLLGGCAFGGGDSDFSSNGLAYNNMPRMNGRSQVEDTGQKPLECVPFARDHSGVKIFGDAYTWWDQAASKYQRAATPESGAVMVLTGYAGPQRGHVAVVHKIISPREIRVDHANWLDDGSIFLNDPVEDVSEDNDWSAVRVFNIKTGAWGGNIYPVKGFILSSSESAQTPDDDGAPPPAPITARLQKPVAKPRAAQHAPSPVQQAVQPQSAYDLTPEDREVETPDDDQDAAPPPVTARVQKPAAKPRSPVQHAPAQATPPQSSYDLTPEDRALEPESADNPGPVAMTDSPRKTR